MSTKHRYKNFMVGVKKAVERYRKENGIQTHDVPNALVEIAESY